MMEQKSVERASRRRHGLLCTVLLEKFFLPLKATLACLLLLCLRREKRRFSRSRRRQKCPRYLKHMRLERASPWAVSVSCWMVNASKKVTRPKCSNSKTRIKLTASWNKAEEGLRILLCNKRDNRKLFVFRRGWNKALGIRFESYRL